MGESSWWLDKLWILRWIFIGGKGKITDVHENGRGKCRTGKRRMNANAGMVEDGFSSFFFIRDAHLRRGSILSNLLWTSCQGINLSWRLRCIIYIMPDVWRDPSQPRLECEWQGEIPHDDITVISSYHCNNASKGSKARNFRPKQALVPNANRGLLEVYNWICSLSIEKKRKGKRRNVRRGKREWKELERNKAAITRKEVCSHRLPIYISSLLLRFLPLLSSN